MERREITIERNVIENAIMTAKDFIKKNRKLVLFSLLGLLLSFALGLGGYIYYEHRATVELARYEEIMERYRTLARAGTANPAGTFVIIEELKSLVKSSSWGFVHDNGNYMIATLYFNTGNYNEAREHYLKYAGANPRSEFAVLAIQKAAVAAEQMGNHDEALRVYQEMERKHGDTPYADQISYDLARMYQKKGDIYKAKEYYHKVITSHPRSVFSARARHRLFLLAYQEKNAK
jgi:tetratricopeptide (TPR) repeat protein